MPRDPKGEKRPADVIGAAVIVGRIATGEIDESTPPPDDGKDPSSVGLGLKGGKGSCGRVKRRNEIAKKAAKSRWGCTTAVSYNAVPTLSKIDHAPITDRVTLG